MKMTNEEYKRYAEKHAPRSHTKGNVLRAFVSGGGICCLGQVLKMVYTALGAETESASAWVSITLVFIGAMLTGLGVYDDIARFAGAGTLVPITGFANSIAAPAIEFRTEGAILGTCVKMFTIAGPVLTCGITASVIYGVILCLMGKSL